MEGHAKKCAERYCELANKKTEQWFTVSTPCLDDHNVKKEELETVGELPDVCSRIVLKCLCLARIGGPDILWSVNKLARAVTKWTRACDRCLARLVSYIHHTNDYRPHCHVRNTAQPCILGLFQDFQNSDFAGDLSDSKSTSGRILCIFGSRTFAPKSWMCIKRTSVSYSSTESEILSLDAGLRMDGVLALDLWDVVIEVLRSSNNVPLTQKISTPKSKLKGAAGNCVWDSVHNIRLKKEGDRNFAQLSHLDHVTTSAHYSQCKAQLYIFEDNEALIKIIEGRSPMMRHVSRTHRVASDWLFDRINLYPEIQIKHVDTKNQLADLLTEGSFTRDEWCILLCLDNIMDLSVFLAATFVQLKRRPPCRREFKKEGRRSCGGKAEVSVFDFNNPEQRAILFLWSGCFIPESPQLDSGSVQGAAGNCRRDLVQNRFQNTETCSQVSKGDNQPQRCCGTLQRSTAQGAMPDGSKGVAGNCVRDCVQGDMPKSSRGEGKAGRDTRPMATRVSCQRISGSSKK